MNYINLSKKAVVQIEDPSGKTTDIKLPRALLPIVIKTIVQKSYYAVCVYDGNSYYPIGNDQPQAENVLKTKSDDILVF